MNFAVKIRGNQSKIIRSLQIGDYSLKIVVIDMPHHSIYGSTRTLAKVLTEGEEGVPARPFMQQFFRENREFIQSAVAKQIKLSGLSNLSEDTLMRAGYDIVDKFIEWVWSGGVQPGNTEATVKRKGHSVTLVGSLQNESHLLYAVRPVVVLRDKRKR